MAYQLQARSQTAVVVSPELPPELVHNIFHHAARRSTQLCLTLCKVSRWTRELALPHLYSVVILEGHNSSSNYTQYILGQKLCIEPRPNSFQPATILRSLWVEAVSQNVIYIVESCDNLVHLALHADNLLWLVHAKLRRGIIHLPDDATPHKGGLHITIIKGNNQTLTRYVNPNSIPTTPFYSLVKRLRLTRIGGYKESLSLAHFAHLTHLAVPFWLPIHDLSALDLALTHRSLELLVVVVYVDLVTAEDRLRVDNWLREKQIEGKQVSIVESRSKRIREEWEEEVRGGKDVWSAGVRLIL